MCDPAEGSETNNVNKSNSDDDGRQDKSSDDSLSSAAVTQHQLHQQQQKAKRKIKATMSLAEMDLPSTTKDKVVGSTVATCEEFVSKFGGKRPIEKVLIANNGIAGKSFESNTYCTMIQY